MELGHRESCACGKSEVDLFTVPPTQVAIDEGYVMEHYPISSVSDQGPIEFLISGSGEEFLDLANTHLHVKAKITKKDGRTAIKTGRAAGEETDPTDAQVGPVNLWMHSLFGQVDVSLNETLVTPSTNTYPYRAYLETLLSHGKESKLTWLSTELWEEDQKGHMDESDNKGLKSRQKRIADGVEVSMYGKIHSELFHQARLIPNGVNIKIRLVRSSDAFNIMSFNDEAYRSIITDACLYVRKVKLSSQMQLDIARQMEKATLKYPVRRTLCKVVSIPTGNMSFNQENLFLGQLPKRLVVGLIDNDAYNGRYSKNPFNFKHHSLNYLALYVDGRMVPSKPLRPDYENKDYVRSYLSLFQNSGLYYTPGGNNINYEEYPSGFTLYALDLTPDLSEGAPGGVGHFTPYKRGNIRLELQFKQALANTVNVVVYAEFDNLLEIDRTRQISFDYSA